jgi:dTDP-4-amino-4,6-dideoxygalactose transaminase
MTRDELAGALLKENIETKKYFYPPLHQQALFRPFVTWGTPHLSATEAVAESVLSLPIYESLPAETVRQVAGAIRGLSQPGRQQGVRAC